MDDDDDDNNNNSTFELTLKCLGNSWEVWKSRPCKLNVRTWEAN